MNGLTLAFLVEVGIITYRDIAKADAASHRVAGLPLPADYIAAGLLYGALGFAPAGGPARVASLFGWGIVIATYMNLWSPSSPLQVGNKTTAAGANATSASTQGSIA